MIFVISELGLSDPSSWDPRITTSQSAELTWAVMTMTTPHGMDLWFDKRFGIGCIWASCCHLRELHFLAQLVVCSWEQNRNENINNNYNDNTNNYKFLGMERHHSLTLAAKMRDFTINPFERNARLLRSPTEKVERSAPAQKVTKYHSSEKQSGEVEVKGKSSRGQKGKMLSSSR